MISGLEENGMIEADEVEIRLDCVDSRRQALMEVVRATLETSGVDVASVDATHIGYGSPTIAYMLRGDTARITVHSDHRPEHLAEIAERQSSRIGDHVRARGAEAMIDRADALLAVKSWGKRQLLMAARPYALPLEIHGAQGRQADHVVVPILETRMAGGVVTRTGGRAAVRVATDTQAWATRTLTVQNRHQLPHQIVAGMVGRPLDDVVGGSIMSGMGLRIAKAWCASNRLGMTFAGDLVTMTQAARMQTTELARAA